jgi:hypothetical protein
MIKRLRNGDETADEQRCVRRKIDKRNAKRGEIKKKDRDIEREENVPLKNLARYRRMTLDQKVEFALAGYVFKNNKRAPAIELCTTRLDAPEDMRRGVKVGKGLPFLPVGFLILFSKASVTRKPQNGVQRFYQVGLTGGRVMQVHTERVEKHGLANFINAPARRGTRFIRASDGDLHQDLTIANCTLKQNTSQYMCDEYRERFPAYVTVNFAIKPGEELLYHYGASYKLP